MLNPCLHLFPQNTMSIVTLMTMTFSDLIYVSLCIIHVFHRRELVLMLKIYIASHQIEYIHIHHIRRAMSSSLPQG
jgi:hypothetical protein